MELLKEYIRLIIKEELEEDVDLKRLKPNMIGIYAFAQAINKLIYEGKALPGVQPIDIIDAGKKIKRAPLTTDNEKNIGMSFQSSGNSFKLYIDPTSTNKYISPGNESHDLFHAITGYLAKAFGRRRQSVKDTGRYSGTPSKFNKLTLKKDIVEKFKADFKKKNGKQLPDEVIEKVFEFGEKNPADYADWLYSKYPKLLKSKTKLDAQYAKYNIKTFAYDLHKAVFGDALQSGLLGHKYWGNMDSDTVDIDTSREKFGVEGGLASKDNPTKYSWKQSIEDEEVFGNIFNALFYTHVLDAKKIEPVDAAVARVMELYKTTKVPSMIAGNVDDINRKYGTFEVQQMLTRLLELYNNLLQRYIVSVSAAQPKLKAVDYKANYYNRAQVDDEQLRQIAAAKKARTAGRKAAPRKAPSKKAPAKKAPARRR